MITAALNENLWVSYDIRSCNLYKAWKGGVKFDGAVYTSTHGPQPTSGGYAYMEDPSEKSMWKVVLKGKEINSSLVYKGHRIWNGHVELLYAITSPDLETPILISESPEYVDNGNPGLERIFVTRDVPDDTEVFLMESLTSMSRKNDYRTNGSFDVISSSEDVYGEVTLYNLEGWLSLITNGATNLTTYFLRPTDVVKSEISFIQTRQNPGFQLIEEGDCRTCHNETIKTVGPAYISIAEKYGDGDNIRNELAEKIISGGIGVWGEVPMTAHPDLTEENARLMVDYILALDAGQEESASDDFFTSPSIALNLSDDNSHENLDPNATFPGLALNVYIINRIALAAAESITFDLIKDTSGDPVLVGPVSGVHLTSSDDFGKYKEWVFHEYNGKISVDVSKTYSFRLISDDGSRLLINGEEIIDNGGLHGNEVKYAEVTLQAGSNDIKVQFYQASGGASVSLQWAKPDGAYEVVPEGVLSHAKSDFRKVIPFVSASKLVRSIPGDQQVLKSVHPAFDVFQARPDEFKPKVGGLDYMSDGKLVVCTWDSIGPVYLVEGANSINPGDIKVTMIAQGLAEPLGIKVVEDTIYVLQKQELTKLVDLDADGIIDEYLVVSNDWRVSANFHEFAFGLVYKDGFFYATLATAILPGGASANPQIPDRGKIIKINRFTGETTFIASGLRTPNGIGVGVDGELFVADNQGDWLPSSKIVHVKDGAWYGSRSVDFEGTEDLTETLPVVWLPQDEIGNSPSQPIFLDKGPYKGQMIHGEVTHGGLKRVFVEKVNGEYQGAVFRFTQGLEGGVNRLAWGDDGALYIGGIGNPGNWSTAGAYWYGLQRMTFNGQIPFEMLKVSAKTNGLELEFTQPVEEGRGISSDEFQVDQWYYLPTMNYGGPKLDLKPLTILSVNVSEDRRKIFLELDGMESNHVVYVRLKDPFLSEDGNSLWTTEAWYTMNNIPEDSYGEKHPAQEVVYNQLLPSEKETGWELLFDGKTTKGWTNYNKETIGREWRVSNGTLTVGRSVNAQWNIDQGGDIVSDKEYKNFELRMDWKIAEGGNSGVIYNVIESEDYGFAWVTGPEYQLLDNLNHANRLIDTHRAGDLFGLISCDFVSVNPAGEWNRLRLIKNNNHVEHWLNGYMVLEYELGSTKWNTLVSSTKFGEMSAFGKAEQGRIALQDQGFKVWFRDIKIKNLDLVQ